MSCEEYLSDITRIFNHGIQAIKRKHDTLKGCILYSVGILYNFGCRGTEVYHISQWHIKFYPMRLCEKIIINY